MRSKVRGFDGTDNSHALQSHFQIIDHRHGEQFVPTPAGRDRAVRGRQARDIEDSRHGLSAGTSGRGVRRHRARRGPGDRVVAEHVPRRPAREPLRRVERPARPEATWQWQ